LFPPSLTPQNTPTDTNDTNNNPIVPNESKSYRKSIQNSIIRNPFAPTVLSKYFPLSKLSSRFRKKKGKNNNVDISQQQRALDPFNKFQYREEEEQGGRKGTVRYVAVGGDEEEEEEEDSMYTILCSDESSFDSLKSKSGMLFDYIKVQYVTVLNCVKYCMLYLLSSK